MPTRRFKVPLENIEKEIEQGIIDDSDIVEPPYDRWKKESEEEKDKDASEKRKSA